jgi:hypothetical protein
VVYRASNLLLILLMPSSPPSQTFVLRCRFVIINQLTFHEAFHPPENEAAVDVSRFGTSAWAHATPQRQQHSGYDHMHVQHSQCVHVSCPCKVETDERKQRIFAKQSASPDAATSSWAIGAPVHTDTPRVGKSPDGALPVWEARFGSLRSAPTTTSTIQARRIGSSTCKPPGV